MLGMLDKNIRCHRGHPSSKEGLRQHISTYPNPPQPPPQKKALFAGFTHKKDFPWLRGLQNYTT